MELEYVLNELSANVLQSKEEANSVMDLFVDVLRNSREIGIKPNVRTHKDMREIELAEGYFVSNWSANQSIGKERRLYILNLLTKSPLLSGLPDQIAADAKEIEVQFEGIQGRGMTVAHLSENPVLSFSSHEKWHSNELAIQVRTLQLDGLTGDLRVVESPASLTNFCTMENLTSNLQKIKELQTTRFDSVNDFWTKKNMLFGCLKFAPKSNIFTGGKSAVQD
jgi:hypothetical protein